MTERELNVAVAEACAFEVLKDDMPNFGGFLCGRRKDVNGGDWTRLADYCHDLNAMHEAEKVLSGDDQFGKYLFWLCEVIGSASCRHPVPNACPTATARFILVHATALQRAEAFLRTLGKWVES